MIQFSLIRQGSCTIPGKALASGRSEKSSKGRQIASISNLASSPKNPYTPPRIPIFHLGINHFLLLRACATFLCALHEAYPRVCSPRKPSSVLYLVKMVKTTHNGGHSTGHVATRNQVCDRWSTCARTSPTISCCQNGGFTSPVRLKVRATES